jgi:hypothetical protein
MITVLQLLHLYVIVHVCLLYYVPQEKELFLLIVGDSVAVEMYLEFACCAAVPGGGRNKEYALHLLHMCHGNIHVGTNS